MRQEKNKTQQMPHGLMEVLDERDCTQQVERIRMIRELRGNERKLESVVVEIMEIVPLLAAKMMVLEAPWWCCRRSLRSSTSCGRHDC
jgi:hypothetical protein